MVPNLLPMPKSFRVRAGRFALEADVPIVISPLSGEEEFIAAGLLAGEIAAATGIRPPIEKHIRFRDLGPVISAGIRKRDGGDFQPAAEGGKLKPQGYFLSIRKSEVRILGADVQGVVNGLRTLRQVVRSSGLGKKGGKPSGKRGRVSLPGCDIRDWPDLEYRGLMVDVTRFKTPKLETLFQLVELLASLKINCFQLYTEHTFSMHRHRDVGRRCDPLTSEDIQKLDLHCRKHCVELQPNFQSFGHQKHMLSLPPYNHLAEITKQPWTLSPVKPGSYKLLDELYEECLSSYSAERFNASCDETWELGKGQSKRKADRIGVGRVYLQHILKIHKLAKKYGKRMMIWGDIVLKHPELIRELPKDLIVLNWGYRATTNFRSSRKFAAAGLEHWVCPGTNAWLSIFPRVETACANIRGFAQAGVRYGAKGILNTNWGDRGNPNMLGPSLHGFVYGAEQGWTAGRKNDRTFDKRFSLAVFSDTSGRFGKLYRALGRTNDAFGKYNHRSVPFWKFWDRFPEETAREDHTAKQVRRSAEYAKQGLKLIEQLRRDFPQEKQVLDECELAARETIFVEKKAVAARALLRALKTGRKPSRKLAKEIQTLRREWRGFAKEFQRLWLVRNNRSQIRYRLGLFRKGERQLRVRK